MRWRALVLAAVVMACGADDAFRCFREEQCVEEGRSGVCEPSGFCSFPDPACGSGRRYASRSPAGLAGVCVGEELLRQDAAARDASTDAGPSEDDARAFFDASRLPADAAPLPDRPPAPDARPDAAPPPDAAPQFTMSFGETGNANVSGVTSDTWINGEFPDRNYGASVEVRSDGDPPRFGMLRFDVSALPTPAIVTRVDLHITTTAQGALTKGSMRAHRILEAWGEGDGNDTTGAPNFSERTVGVPWAAAGVGPGSRENSVLVSFVPSLAQRRYAIGLPTSLVQGWLDDASRNYGIVFVGHKTENLSMRFHSSESSSVVERPLLVVQYRLM